MSVYNILDEKGKVVNTIVATDNFVSAMDKSRYIKLPDPIIEQEVSESAVDKLDKIISLLEELLTLAKSK